VPTFRCRAFGPSYSLTRAGFPMLQEGLNHGTRRNGDGVLPPLTSFSGAQGPFVFFNLRAPLLVLGQERTQFFSIPVVHPGFVSHDDTLEGVVWLLFCSAHAALPLFVSHPPMVGREVAYLVVRQFYAIPTCPPYGCLQKIKLISLSANRRVAT